MAASAWLPPFICPGLGCVCCLLLVQVWCRPVPEAHAAELPPLYAGLSAVPAGSDALLGCAALDLSALQLLGAVDGWYNITDVHQQPRGQIKVRVPCTCLNTPGLCALDPHYCLHLSMGQVWDGWDTRDLL